MKIILDKITHKSVVVKNLQRPLSLSKLSTVGHFALQLPNSCVTIPKMLWGLKEEGDFREPTVRSNVPGSFSELIEPDSRWRSQFFRPDREVSATDCSNFTNQRLTFLERVKK